jgi:hypothetical protein
MAEEARQQTVRIIKSSSRARDKLTTAEKETLRIFKKSADLTILPADKGNATVILNPVDYKQKITSRLEDPSYRRPDRHPTDSTERKTTLLLKILGHTSYLPAYEDGTDRVFRNVGI